MLNIFMKRVIYTIIFALTIFLVACSGTETKSSNDSEVPSTSANSMGDKLNSISEPEKDSSGAVCLCEHKCKSKEECDKQCGDDCDELNK